MKVKTKLFVWEIHIVLRHKGCLWESTHDCLLTFTDLVDLVGNINDCFKVYTCYLVLLPCWGIMVTIYLTTTYCGSNKIVFVTWTCRYVLTLLVIMCPAVALNSEVCVSNIGLCVSPSLRQAKQIPFVLSDSKHKQPAEESQFSKAPSFCQSRNKWVNFLEKEHKIEAVCVWWNIERIGLLQTKWSWTTTWIQFV